MTNTKKMEIWLDTTDLQSIAAAREMGVLHGVTTNPSLLAKSGKKPLDAVRAVLKAQPGPVTVQVTAKKASDMVMQAIRIRKLSRRIIVKVPVTKEGLRATAKLSKAFVPVMATAVFSVSQALLAARAGAKYVALYLGRLQKARKDAYETMDGILEAFEEYNIKTKLLTASIKTREHFEQSAVLGAHAITIPDVLLPKLIDHSLTRVAVKRFDADWKRAEKDNWLK